MMLSMFCSVCCGHVPRGYIQFLPRILHFSAVHFNVVHEFLGLESCFCKQLLHTRRWGWCNVYNYSFVHLMTLCFFLFGALSHPYIPSFVFSTLQNKKNITSDIETAKPGLLPFQPKHRQGIINIVLA